MLTGKSVLVHMQTSRGTDMIPCGTFCSLQPFSIFIMNDSHFDLLTKPNMNYFLMV